MKSLYKIAICDDEERYVAKLNEMVERYAGENDLMMQTLSFYSGDALLKNWLEPDILLLDINMKGLDGIETARSIRGFDKSVCIIFITSVVGYSLKGYEVRAFGFLPKPVTYGALALELSDAFEMISRTPAPMLRIKSGTQNYQIPCGNIRYIESVRHGICVYYNQEDLFVRTSLTSIETPASKGGIFRCHHAFLVNVHQIARLTSTNAILHSGQHVPISKARRAGFMEQFLQEVRPYA